MVGKRMRKKLITVTAALIALMPAPVLAQVTIVPECARVKAAFGQPVPVPQLSCMLEMLGNVALLILGISGSIALFMFVYGGFMIMLSATSGSGKDKVNKGKTIIRNAVLGILIIMVSGIVLQYAVKQLGISNKFKIVGQPCGSGNKVYVHMPDGSIGCEAVQVPGEE